MPPLIWRPSLSCPTVNDPAPARQAPGCRLHRGTGCSSARMARAGPAVLRAHRLTCAGGRAMIADRQAPRLIRSAYRSGSRVASRPVGRGVSAVPPGTAVSRAGESDRPSRRHRVDRGPIAFGGVRGPGGNRQVLIGEMRRRLVRRGKVFRTVIGQVGGKNRQTGKREHTREKSDRQLRHVNSPPTAASITLDGSGMPIPELTHGI